MEEEDEIDVLGDFNLESLLTKDEDKLSSCYDGDHQLGLQCESQWMLESTSQACWYEKSDTRQFGECSALESCDNNSWTDKEKYLLEKGLELFGRSWSRLAQYIGTKNANQVKSHVKTMVVGWSGKLSGSTSSFGVDSMDLNVSELINDMDIPASVEEVIAAVSTAQPTVVLPSSQRDIPTVHRKLNTRRKKKSFIGTKRRLVAERPKGITQIYKAEDIKDVLTGSKERDYIVLPNGEQVIRIRRGSNLSEDSDVDIDVDSDLDNVKDEISCEGKDTCKNEMHETNKDIIDAEKSLLCKEETSLISTQTEKKENEMYFVDDIGKEVSVSTYNILEERGKCVKKETQIFKGSLVTPSGKIMTVILDDMPCNSDDIGPKSSEVVSKYLSTVQERLDAVNQLPPPFQENIIDRCIVTEEEKILHPEFFSKMSQGMQRYLKIRNHIVDCWINSKPKYVSKTSVRFELRNCGDVNLISRIHAYLEIRGYINFGCEQCHYNCSKTQANHCSTKSTHSQIVSEEHILKPCDISAPVQAEKRESRRPHKKKLPFDEKSIEGGYTMIHTGTGEVVDSYESSSKSSKTSTKRKKPIRLVHCKSYSAGNTAPYRLEMEVSALVLVDIHSHLSPKSEVIGLLGGKYTPQEGGVLSITTAVPCRTILSSNIHCDMCPVSQLESSETIAKRGLTVVGWYHSHPDFEPSPSETDIDTQNMLQSWFNEIGKPFVGLIISPYYSVLNVSSYRFCHVVMEKNSPVPYKLDCKLINIDESIILLRKSIEAAYKTLQTIGGFKHRVTYRCLESVRHHLKKASPRVEEEKMSQVIGEIHDFFNSVSTKSLLVT